MKMAERHFGSPALCEDACKSAVAIGEKIVDKEPKSVAAVMAKVLEIVEDTEIADRAKVLVARSKSSKARPPLVSRAVTMPKAA